MAPVAGVSGRCGKEFCELTLINLGFLNAKYVGLRFLKPLKEPLFAYAPDAVYVPGGDAQHLGSNFSGVDRFQYAWVHNFTVVDVDAFHQV